MPNKVSDVTGLWFWGHGGAEWRNFPPVWRMEWKTCFEQIFVCHGQVFTVRGCFKHISDIGNKGFSYFSKCKLDYFRQVGEFRLFGTCLFLTLMIVRCAVVQNFGDFSRNERSFQAYKSRSLSYLPHALGITLMGRSLKRFARLGFPSLHSPDALVDRVSKICFHSHPDTVLTFFSLVSFQNDRRATARRQAKAAWPGWRLTSSLYSTTNYIQHLDQQVAEELLCPRANVVQSCPYC